MEAVRVPKKLMLLSVIVLFMLCALGWAIYTGSHARSRLSLALSSGSRLELILTRCTTNNPAFAWLMYIDTTRQNRFIQEHISVLAHLPIIPPCP